VMNQIEVKKSSVCLSEQQKKAHNKKMPNAELGTRTFGNVSFN